MTAHVLPFEAPVAPSADLADALDAAVRLAALAPSSHNSQPWALAVAAAGPLRARLAAHLAATGAAPIDPGAPLLVLGLDRARSLRALPAAHALEMDLSCGAYVEVLVRALATRGWSAGHVHADDSRTLARALGAPWPVTWEPLAVIALRREAGGSPARHTALATALTARRTNRGPYLPRPMTRPMLDALAVASSALAPSASFAPRVITDRKTIEAAAGVVRRFAAYDFHDFAAWSETYAFIHWTDAAARGAERGFPITQLFGPMPGWKRRALRVLLSPHALAFLKYLGAGHVLARGLAQLVAAGPALVAMELSPQAPLSRRLAAGGAMLDLWLRAGAVGLALHPVSVVLQHDDARVALERAVSAEGRVFFFARVGQPTTTFPPAPRVRRPERDVVLL
jgi:nitroreductase